MIYDWGGAVLREVSRRTLDTHKCMRGEISTGIEPMIYGDNNDDKRSDGTTARKERIIVYILASKVHVVLCGNCCRVCARQHRLHNLRDSASDELDDRDMLWDVRLDVRLSTGVHHRSDVLPLQEPNGLSD